LSPVLCQIAIPPASSLTTCAPAVDRAWIHEDFSSRRRSSRSFVASFVKLCPGIGVENFRGNFTGAGLRIGITLSPPVKISLQMTSGFASRKFAASAPTLWTDLLDRLRDRIPETAYNTWFSHLRLEEAGEAAWVIAVPNAFVLEYVEHHYRAVIEEAAGAAAGAPVAVRFTLADPARDADSALSGFHPVAEEIAEVAEAPRAVPGPRPAVTGASTPPLQARFTRGGSA